MNKYLFQLVVVVFTCLHLNIHAASVKQDGFEYHIEPIADWIVSQPLPPAKLKKDLGASWLLSDTQVLMTKDQYARFYHYGVKVNLESGLKDASETGIYFQPDFQQLKINFVRRHRHGEVLEMTKAVDIRLLQREEGISQGIYDGGVTARLLIPDVQVGDTIEYAYTIEGNNPIFKGQYFTGFPLNWSVNVDKVFVQLTTDKALNYKVYNADDKNLQHSQQGNRHFYHWSASNVSAVYDEGEYPGWYDPYMSVRFSEHDSWSGVVDWATEFYQISTIKNTKLLKLAAKWAKQSKTKQAYVEKVVRYAQNNIRYFGIEIGQNSHRPYSPDEVFERKYGDCKDKTMFINTLLSMQGIEAYPALVSSRSTKAIQKLIPQPGAFDHVISTFFLNGKQYWVDGTRSFQFGDIENIGISDFQYALLVKPGTNSLSTINTPVKTNEIILSEVYQADSFNGPAQLTATFEYAYAQAENTRSFLKSEGIKHFSKSYMNFYAKQFPSIQLLGNAKIVDDEKHNRVTVKLNFEIANYWTQNQAQYELPLYGDLIAEYIAKPSVSNRKMPLYNPYPIKLKHDILINYPNETNWNLNELLLDIGSPQLHYKREIIPKADSIRVTHEFETLSDHIDVASVTDYLEKTNSIREAIYYSVGIDNREFQQENTQDLKTLVKRLLKQGRN
ncbi:DUF3857 domain-containing transglutaminase family protein [Aliikangiella sp. IMCC44632]